MEEFVKTGTVEKVSGNRAWVRFRGKRDAVAELTILQRSGCGITIPWDGQHTHRISDTYSGGGSASTQPSHNHSGALTTTWAPKVGDKVVCLLIPGGEGQGFVIGAI